MNEDIWTNQWGCGRDKLIFSHGESNARGVITSVRESLDIKVTSVFRDNNGRLINLYAYIYIYSGQAISLGQLLCPQ